MAIFEAGLVAYLEAYVGLNALIGERVYPGKLREECEKPAITFHRITTTREVAHDGPLEIAKAPFQFDVWAETYKEAKLVAVQLRLALLGFAGTMGGVQVWITSQSRESDEQEPETGLHRVSMDFRVGHK